MKRSTMRARIEEIPQAMEGRRLLHGGLCRRLTRQGTEEDAERVLRLRQCGKGPGDDLPAIALPRLGAFHREGNHEPLHDPCAPHSLRYAIRPPGPTAPPRMVRMHAGARPYSLPLTDDAERFLAGQALPQARTRRDRTPRAVYASARAMTMQVPGRRTSRLLARSACNG